MADPASPLSVVCLTGTCGSGKSAVAEALVRAFGYLVVDGDCAMQAYRHRAGGVGTAYDTPELLAELTNEIAAVGRFSTRVALAHVAPAPVADRLRALFARRGWRTLFVLLRPPLETALRRSRSRTCHVHVTPEKWVRHFHALCAPEAGGPPGDTRLLDNGAQTAAESAAIVHNLAEAYFARVAGGGLTCPG